MLNKKGSKSSLLPSPASQREGTGTQIYLVYASVVGGDWNCGTVLVQYW